MPPRRYGRFNPRPPSPAERRFDRNLQRTLIGGPLAVLAGVVSLAVKGAARVHITPPADPYRRYRRIDWRFVGGAAVVCGILWLLAVWWLR